MSTQQNTNNTYLAVSDWFIFDQSDCRKNAGILKKSETGKVILVIDLTKRIFWIFNIPKNDKDRPDLGHPKYSSKFRQNFLIPQGPFQLSDHFACA